jgi:hypothetical protein
MPLKHYEFKKTVEKSPVHGARGREETERSCMGSTTERSSLARKKKK